MIVVAVFDHVFDVLMTVGEVLMMNLMMFVLLDDLGMMCLMMSWCRWTHSS